MTVSTFVTSIILFSLTLTNPLFSLKKDKQPESPATEVTWLTNIEEATQTAADQQKPILMVFSGSDWCKPCILLKKNILESEEFQNYAAEHLILLELDFPASKKNRLSKEQTAHNEQLADQFNPKGQFPYMVLLNDQKTVLDAFTYKKNTEPTTYIEYIKSLNK